ncbi:MAG: glycosyltransferase [Ignavibacteriales bacterium]|nr:glycosyltransferase [Ignavibacteriales bacterium]
MKIVYVGMRYDYGDPRLGDCYEYSNFHDTLARMPGVTVEDFPYDEILRQEGKKVMNERLRSTARQRPDLYFFVLFTDEFFHETVDWLTRHSGALTLNWFGDDHWRFDLHSRFWAPLFTWVITTDQKAVDRYRAIGVNNVILSQWGFNHHLMDGTLVREELDVSFVGRTTPGRKAILRRLQKEGIDVTVWGRGWKNGRLSPGDMIQTFKRSRINLNFTESMGGLQPRTLAKAFLARRADQTISLRPLREVGPAVRLLLSRPRPQIKGRNFEIPGHGGFLLTSAAEGLDRYYSPGREIEVWNDPNELVQKIRYYLTHGVERNRMKEEGRRRTLAEHTYERRFREIFRTMGITGF